MKNILFVDDESLVLSALRRLLRPFAKDWKMTFVTSGVDALTLMGRESFDVVVTDMRMPGMTGTEFLTQVKSAHPSVARLVLSGHSDEADIQRAVVVAHQFLSKPCDADLLRDTVMRVAQLGELLHGDELRNAVGSIGALPAAPSVLIELQRALGEPEVAFGDVAKIIEGDPGLTAKILQIVNSSFYGLRARVCDMGSAVSRLGTNVVRDLVLDVELRKAFSGPVAVGFDLEASRNRGVLCSRLAGELLTTPEAQRLARCAGLVHDVGELVFASRFQIAYAHALAESESTDTPIHEAESKIWGISHADLGGYLLGVWGLPTPIVESVVYHHTPSLSAATEFGVLGAVHVAAAFAQTIDNPRLDLDFLRRVGRSDDVESWRSRARVLHAQVGGGN